MIHYPNDIKLYQGNPVRNTLKDKGQSYQIGYVTFLPNVVQIYKFSFRINSTYFINDGRRLFRIQSEVKNGLFGTSRRKQWTNIIKIYGRFKYFRTFCIANTYLSWDWFRRVGAEQTTRTEKSEERPEITRPLISVNYCRLVMSPLICEYFNTVYRCGTLVSSV